MYDRETKVKLHLSLIRKFIALKIVMHILFQIKGILHKLFTVEQNSTKFLKMLVNVPSTLKSMFNQGLVYTNRPYFESIGPNWSKLGSFADKHYILHVIDLISG